MKRKIVCLVLVAAMISTMMLGCGAKKENSTESSLSDGREVVEDLTEKEETEEVEETDEITADVLKTAINDTMRSYDNGAFFIGNYYEEIDSSKALMEIGTSADHSVIYYSMKMFGIDGMYQDANTSTIYYYDSKESKWFKSESSEDFKDLFEGDLKQDEILEGFDIFDTAISTEYTGEKAVGDKDCYVLNVVTSEESKIEFDEEIGEYKVPVDGGMTIYVSEGISTTYNGVEYKVDKDGNVTADGEAYIPPKSTEVAYDMYVDKESMKLYAMSYEDSSVNGVLYTVISFDDLSIPDEVLSAEDGDYDKYMESLSSNMFGNLTEDTSTEE